VIRDGPWPDPTPAYFLSAVIKKPTCLWPRYFFEPTSREFIWPEKEKIEKFGMFRGNFPNLDPNQKSLNRPLKIFDPVPSLIVIKSSLIVIQMNAWLGDKIMNVPWLFLQKLMILFSKLTFQIIKNLFRVKIPMWLTYWRCRHPLSGVDMAHYHGICLGMGGFLVRRAQIPGLFLKVTFDPRLPQKYNKK